MNRPLTQHEMAQLVITMESYFKGEEVLYRTNGFTDDQFLEHINQVVPIEEATTERMIKAALDFTAPISLRRIEYFLMYSSKKCTVDKWTIAKKYNLEKLKNRCFVEIEMAEVKKAEVLARLKRDGQFPGLEKKKVEEVEKMEE